MEYKGCFPDDDFVCYKNAPLCAADAMNRKAKEGFYFFACMKKRCAGQSSSGNKPIAFPLINFGCTM